jgi:iron-sulfur cluster repair protein YtfE (RIC family)
MSDLDLKARAGLPDALRVLLEEHPREAWEAHPNFSGLVQFWLERHMMFRRLLDLLEEDAKALRDRQMAAPDYAARLNRLGGALVQQLHGHHQIEDLHYFPTLARLDPRLTEGFDLLERDHEALDGLLHAFGQKAGAAVRAAAADEAQAAAPIDDFARSLAPFERLLLRHLEDEEELVVPVILRADPGVLD